MTAGQSTHFPETAGAAPVLFAVLLHDTSSSSSGLN